MSHPSDDQKKAMYENLSPEQKKKQTYTEWVKDAYSNQYEHWMPWIEDKYLAWFGTDNKASYATKGMYLQQVTDINSATSCALLRTLSLIPYSGPQIHSTKAK